MNFIVVAVLIACLWGLQPLIQKHLMKDFSSHSILMISNVIFTVCLMVYGFFYREMILDDFKRLETHHWQLLLFSAIICSFLTSITYFELIKNHKSSIVMAITYSAPLFTVLFSEFFFNEKIEDVSKVGIGFVVLGISIMCYGN
jgi:uncharacterized membrane protein